MARGRIKSQFTNETSESIPTEKITLETKQVAEVNVELDEAINLHKLGAGGDKRAVKEAHEILKKICERDPENVLANAYFGSAITLLGRDEINPNERFNLAIKGLKILDRMITKEPDNTEIRFLRGNVCLRLPEMYFHRTETAIEDFKHLISCYERDESAFSKDTYDKTLFDLGQAYKNLNRTKEAHIHWEKLLNITEDKKYLSLVKQAGFYKVPQVKADDKEYEGKNLSTDKESKPLSEQKKKLEEGIELHTKAFTGGSNDIQKALEYFEKKYGENPEDPLIIAFYADCLSLSAREAKEPTSLFGNTIKAIKLFDNAVNTDSENIQVRLLRGLQSYRLPEAFFKRTATAMCDFEYLIKRYEEDKNSIPGALYAKLLFLLGKSYQRMNMEEESKGVFEKLLKVSKEEKYRKLAQIELKDETAAFGLPKSMEGLSRQELINQGIRLHDLAVEGNQKALNKGLEILEELYEETPDNPLIEGYYGSIKALSAKYSTDSQGLFDNAINGLKHIKHALSRDSSNVTLRILRANVFYNLPEVFFHLSDKAGKDFKYLVTAYEADSHVITKECYEDCLYHLGMCYMRSGNIEKAKKTWQKLKQVTTNTKYRDLLKDIMDWSDAE